MIQKFKSILTKVVNNNYFYIAVGISIGILFLFCIYVLIPSMRGKEKIPTVQIPTIERVKESCLSGYVVGTGKEYQVKMICSTYEDYLDNKEFIDSGLYSGEILDEIKFKNIVKMNYFTMYFQREDYLYANKLK